VIHGAKLTAFGRIPERFATHTCCNLIYFMASATTPQCPGGSKNLTEGQKAAIVTLREVNKLTFPQIATKLGVDDKAAGQAFRKAKRDAMRQNSRPYYTLAELIAASKPKHHPGRLAKVANGSELSKSIRADII
jgi:hypothetical protein